MNNREHLKSRIGFIMLSAGCAIGCGNVWKFPWMAGQYGGGVFVLIYIICLFILGLPVMTMELALGRASQASPVRMYQNLEKKGQKWHIHGYLALLGNICLMAFYAVVAGWMIYYFIQFSTGNSDGLSYAKMSADAGINVIYLAVTMLIATVVLCFNLQGGLERVTKYIMTMLMALMLALAIRSILLPGAAEGLRFYLVPDIKNLNGSIIVAAMNQAFFSLSIGIGAMAIFGSYIDKERSLMGESVNIIMLDTFVAIVAGFIIFPACFTYGQEVTAGPGLLFDTMATVFNNMEGGRWWGALFFLFMIFAAISTVLAVMENILSCVHELTGWSRPKSSLICGIFIFLISLTSALGKSKLSFHPFGAGTSWSDFWDFITNTNLLPIGAVIFTIFCCYKIGWGWDNFVQEANTGKGLKVKAWMKPIFKFFVPAAVIFLYIYGLITFDW